MAPEPQFQTLTSVAISEEERISGTLSPEHAAIAIHALHKDGIVCIENAADLDHIATLHEILTAEVDSLQKARGTNYVNVR